MGQRVLSFHYILTNSAGETLDSSRGQEPFPVLEGRKQIIPLLEEALFQMQPGDKKIVNIPADKAYGTMDEGLKVKVNRSKLPEGEIKVGMRFRGGAESNAPIFMVTQIEGEDVSLDGNHPLAGQDLTFDVEVMEIREATAEELEHGHAHGAGGHGHSH